MNVSIELIKDVVSIAKYLLWDNDMGREKAHEMISEIHDRKYGSAEGIWPQADIAVQSLAIQTERKEWISVEERLPELNHPHFTGQSGDVLCYSPRGIEVGRRCFSDCWFSDSGANITKKITHWMPLPDPPKGK